MSEPKPKPFWNSLPGYLTGIAAMLNRLTGSNQIGVIVSGKRQWCGQSAATARSIWRS